MSQVPENKLLRVETLCTFLEKCLNAKPADRVKHFRLLLEKRLKRNAADLFQVIRLILPSVRWQKPFAIKYVRIQGWLLLLRSSLALL